jgi:hypothetical protein
MGIGFWESGGKTRGKEKESSGGKMAIFIKESGKMIWYFK